MARPDRDTDGILAEKNHGQDGRINIIDATPVDAAQSGSGKDANDEPMRDKDAVLIALTSGLTHKQVADDLAVGISTLNKWITAHRDTDVVSKEDLGLAQENDRLRRENRILKEERAILKKTTQFFAGLKQ